MKFVNKYSNFEISEGVNPTAPTQSKPAAPTQDDEISAEDRSYTKRKAGEKYPSETGRNVYWKMLINFDTVNKILQAVEDKNIHKDQFDEN